MRTLPAIVDMGSFLSVANWMAAAKAGVSPDSPEVNRSAMSAVGIDGRQMPMATAPFDLEVMGVEGRGEKDGGGRTPSRSRSLTSLYRGQCCVGDLPAFASLGAETSPFASMGLDVIGRGRTVFVPAGGKMWLTPGGVYFHQRGGTWSCSTTRYPEATQIEIPEGVKGP